MLHHPLTPELADMFLKQSRIYISQLQACFKGNSNLQYGTQGWKTTKWNLSRLARLLQDPIEMISRRFSEGSCHYIALGQCRPESDVSTAQKVFLKMMSSSARQAMEVSIL